LIILVLPFIILGLLFKAVIALAQGATRIIAVILVLVCCSNFLATFLSHYVGEWIYQFDFSMALPKTAHGLLPLWHIELPKLLANSHAMIIGIIAGIILPRFSKDFAQRVARYADQIVTQILKVIVLAIPFFVAGFIIKLQDDGVVITILRDYTLIFAVVGLAQALYLTLIYFALSKWQLKECARMLKNLFPATLSGFSTMSSAASMPLTIVGAENNAVHKDLVRSVIPATVNIHLLGDCLAIPIFAYAVLKSFGMPAPSLINYLIFNGYFVLAKFSVAAIPGGGILVMLPILESYLGFNGDMMSLITALYILFDPVVTCANVLGNGGFAKLMDRLYPYVVKRPQ
jgi:Na+/H+-dicarboxylate symporter